MNQILFEMYIGVITNFQKNLTMDIKFRITKYLAVSALAMLLLGACSKTISTSTILTKKTTEVHPAPAMMTTTAIRPKRMRWLLSVLP